MILFNQHMQIRGISTKDQLNLDIAWCSPFFCFEQGIVCWCDIHNSKVNSFYETNDKISFVCNLLHRVDSFSLSVLRLTELCFRPNFSPQLMVHWLTVCSINDNNQMTAEVVKLRCIMYGHGRWMIGKWLMTWNWMDFFMFIPNISTNHVHRCWIYQPAVDEHSTPCLKNVHTGRTWAVELQIMLRASLSGLIKRSFSELGFVFGWPTGRLVMFLVE